MPATFDQELTDRANAILRRGDHRLAAAGGLQGKIAVLWNPTNPPKPPTEPKPKGRKAPPRVDGSRPAGGAEESGEVSAPPPGPPKVQATWHKLAVPAKSSEPSLNGERFLAKITIDGGIWGQLGESARDEGIFLALRALRFKEGPDGSDGCEVERPPIRVWPDSLAEAGDLMAALVSDPKAAAALTGALRSGDPAEDLGDAIDAIERLVVAGNDAAPSGPTLLRAAARLAALAAGAPEEGRGGLSPDDAGAVLDAFGEGVFDAVSDPGLGAEGVVAGVVAAARARLGLEGEDEDPEEGEPDDGGESEEDAQ